MERLTEIVSNLAQVIQKRELSSLEPWNYGWSEANYRRCPRAAIAYRRDKSVQLPEASVVLFEEATNLLLRQKPIQDLYEKDEFWEMMASLVGALPLESSTTEISVFLETRLERILNPPDSLVILPVANVAPLSSILDFGPMLIGHLGEPFEVQLRNKTGRNLFVDKPGKPWWLNSPENPPAAKAPILLAYAGKVQLGKAVDHAELLFEDLTNLALMIQEDLDAMSLYSLRGDTNRPGIRGLVIDRADLSKRAQAVPEIGRELYSTLIIDGVLGPHITYRSYGEDPFPLEKLLSISEKRRIAEKILFHPTPICERLRVAARWHAKAHWALETADAVLALGICFDSMLTETGPSPGRVISERFALLHPDPDARRRRYRQFQREFYPARSSVAHGARRTGIDFKFVRRMAQESCWVFNRIFQCAEALGISTEEEYADMFESLKWDSRVAHLP